MGLEVLLAHLPLASHEIVTAVAIDTGGSASVARTRARRLTSPSWWRRLVWGPTGAAGSPWRKWRRLRSSRRRPTSSIRLATSAGLANTAARWPACSFLVRSRGCPDGVGYHTDTASLIASLRRGATRYLTCSAGRGASASATARDGRDRCSSGPARRPADLSRRASCRPGRRARGHYGRVAERGDRRDGPDPGGVRRDGGAPVRILGRGHGAGDQGPPRAWTRSHR